ncbi:MAG: HNH endonuclease [Saprospiraceae bacterium]
MSLKISKSLRLKVRQRADSICEYCKIPDLGFAFPFHVDHIRAIKHGGKSMMENLAYCCPDCNFFKGTDFATFLGKQVVLFFNPRNEKWEDHFEMRNGMILPLTEIGQATTHIFQFNLPARIAYRLELESAGF